MAPKPQSMLVTRSLGTLTHSSTQPLPLHACDGSSESGHQALPATSPSYPRQLKDSVAMLQSQSSIVFPELGKAVLNL